MAKKKKRCKMAASSLIDLFNTDGTDVDPPVPTNPPQEKPSIYEALCDYCGQRRPVSYTESDFGWEKESHRNHINRQVCIECFTEVNRRDECAELVTSAMRSQLLSKGLSVPAAEDAVQLAWRSFIVERNYDDLRQWAKKLKIKHDWLNC